MAIIRYGRLLDEGVLRVVCRNTSRLQIRPARDIFCHIDVTGVQIPGVRFQSVLVVVGPDKYFRLNHSHNHHGNDSVLSSERYHEQRADIMAEREEDCLLCVFVDRKHQKPSHDHEHINTYKQTPTCCKRRLYPTRTFLCDLHFERVLSAAPFTQELESRV